MPVTLRLSLAKIVSLSCPSSEIFAYKALSGSLWDHFLIDNYHLLLSFDSNGVFMGTPPILSLSEDLIPGPGLMASQDLMIEDIFSVK